MKSKGNAEQTSQTGATLVLLLTLGLTGASLLGGNPIQAIVAEFSAVVWTVIVILTFLTFRGKADRGNLLLIQAAAVLTGIGLTLKDANDVPFGIFGGLMWTAVLLASFVFGLLYFAQFVLPLTGNEGWSEGLRLLARHCCLNPPPATGSENSKAGKSKSAKEADDRDALPPSFATLQAGILKSHDVMALTKGSGFSRPVGPGFAMLFKGEKVADKIDLRKHHRSERVKANTRDGIPLETDVYVTFRVRQSLPDEADEELLHPYDREAVFSVSYANSIGEEDELHAWKERPARIAAALLGSEISRCTLNDLFQGDEAGIPVFDAIRERIREQLARSVSQDGVEIVDVDFEQFQLPQRVIDQRIKTWQADWKRKIVMQKASGNAEALRRIKRARARAQIEIIENITQNIHAMRQSGDADLSEIIMLRMIEALEKAVSDESVQTLIPQQVMAQLVMDSTERLQAWVKRPEGEKGG